MLPNIISINNESTNIYQKVNQQQILKVSQKFEKNQSLESCIFQIRHKQNLYLKIQSKCQVKVKVHIIYINKNWMDIRDFEGLFKFKLIIPILYIINWVCMFVGPSFFPVVYQRLTIILLLYILAKILWVLLTITIVLIRSWRYMSRLEDEEQGRGYRSLTNITEQLNYAFIIPNYKEQIELIAKSLQVLGKHKRAKSNYLVFLAMEAHEDGSDKKAQQLVQQFRNTFRVIDYTRHQVRQHEQKGKASNVSWCAQNLHRMFEKYMINPDSVMITIMDVDSWAPDLYFDVLQQKIYQQYEERHLRSYQPIQIFTRNHLQVPITTRVYDVLHSFAHMTNSWSYYDLTYPLSNYTMSYNLIKRIGFWDTCPDAIGQDFHTMMKALWKTKMQVKSRPIHVPFNQVNISTGNGYWSDVKARFWQAERHAKGVADVAYNFKMILTQPFKFKNLLVFWFCFEAFALAATFPWMMLSLNYQSYILYKFDKPSPELFSQTSVGYIFTLTSIIGTISYILYQVVKRRANRLIYKQQNESVLRLLEYPIVFMPLFYTFSVPTFIIAAFSTLFGKQQYVVADKKLHKKQQIK